VHSNGHYSRVVADAGPVVAVAGATGALGSAICARLRSNGFAVRELSRPEVDLTDPGSLPDAVRGADCVVSTATCFPRDPSPGAIDRVDRDGNLALVETAEAVGVERFVFVSFKPVALDFPLQRAKRAVEERLLASSMRSVTLRPGKFMDVWLSPLCGFDPAKRTAAIFGAGTRPLTWIARDDVAELVLHVVADEDAPQVLELGGPEALSQQEVVEIYEQADGSSWTRTQISSTELERQLESGSELESSLAALMLEAHLGATTDMTSVLERYPVRLTTVRELARGGS
jgi:uncharacterized protein YbjT (DUF2867 family)